MNKALVREFSMYQKRYGYTYNDHTFQISTPQLIGNYYQKNSLKK